MLDAVRDTTLSTNKYPYSFRICLCVPHTHTSHVVVDEREDMTATIKGGMRNREIGAQWVTVVRQCELFAHSTATDFHGRKLYM